MQLLGVVLPPPAAAAWAWAAAAAAAACISSRLGATGGATCAAGTAGGVAGDIPLRPVGGSNVGGGPDSAGGSPAPDPPAGPKYSLLTQFRSDSGIRPTIARRISDAAISRSSVHDASEYQAACGVQMRLGASFSGPAGYEPVGKSQGRQRKPKPGEYRIRETSIITFCVRMHA